MDSIVLFYCADGIEYVDKIKQKFSRHGISVEPCLIQVGSCPKDNDKRQCCILLLTPDTDKYMRDQTEYEFYQKMFSDFQANVILCHELVDLKSNSVVDHMSQIYNQVSDWKVIPMDGTRIGFKKALLDVMSIVESPTSAPLLNLYTLVPPVISNVSIMFRLKIVLQYLQATL